MNPILWI